MKNGILLLAIFPLLCFETYSQTVTDFDGNVYPIVTIGSQIWMAANLRVTHYLNGDAIPDITDNGQWGSLGAGARCYINNDSTANALIYGALYNWNALADTRKLCPSDWHVASDAEWNVLATYLDNTVDTIFTGWSGTDVGGKLKETGTVHWLTPNTGATNSSGFSAVPSGYRDAAGNFLVFGVDCGWWTTTEYDPGNVFGRGVDYISSQIYRDYTFGKAGGFSVRCLRDSLATRIHESGMGQILHIYPNPATNILYINDLQPEMVDMRIYNTTGMCVLQKTLHYPHDEVDIRSICSGAYIIQIKGNDVTLQHKLIRE